MHTIKKLALGLALLLTLTACAGPAASSPSPSAEPSETPAAQPASLPELEALRELVDWQADEYLAGVFETREDAIASLALREVYTGLTLEDGAAATMALFTVLNTPHVAGFQRTVVLLLDGEMKPHGQAAVAADSVEFQQLDDSHVLFLQTSRSTGISSYYLTLLKATPSGWEDQTESSGLVLDELGELYYSLSMGDLYVFENTVQGQPFDLPEYRQLCVLHWMGEEKGGFQDYAALERS